MKWGRRGLEEEESMTNLEKRETNHIAFMRSYKRAWVSGKLNITVTYMIYYLNGFCNVTDGPPGPFMAVFVATDGPLGQVWLPQMVHFAVSGPPVFQS